MKKPIQELAEEHGGIVLILKIMESVASRIRERKEVKREDLKRIMEFLQVFADQCHHGKEEQTLFPEMAKVPEHVALINELLAEHKAARDLIRGMAEALPGFVVGNPDALHFAVNAEGYTRLLEEHIRKENSVLFPMAMAELSEPVQAEMERKFEQLEQEVIGPGKHELYHHWLEELRKTYLA